MKATMSSMLILCLVVVLAACDEASHLSAAATLTIVASYAPISAAEAIGLAKQAAAPLPSPPRIYYYPDNYNGDNRYSPVYQVWPDEPGAEQGDYNQCSYEGCYFPMTFTTSIKLDETGSGWLVTFTSEWAGSVRGGTHNWQFHVWNDRRVDFIKEEGTSLPKMP